MHGKSEPLITEIITRTIDDNVTVTILPALSDNYIFVLRDEAHKLTFAIDPSVSSSVLALCQEKHWKLDGVLLTHHHGDHVDGAAELAKLFNCPVYGNIHDLYRLPQVTNPLETDGEINLKGLIVRHFATPGHTAGHLCYFFPELAILFSGDTLFSYGCGRLFEGTAEQMMFSLGEIRKLPGETLVFCAHEYTKKNLAFALTLEPESEGLHKKYLQAQTQRGQHHPTIPSLLEDETEFSPFLRWDDLKLREALGMEKASDLEVFTEIRERRNHF